MSNIVNDVWPKLWQHVSWPSLAEWIGMRGHWPLAPNVIGAIDGTSHEIYMPSIEPQEQFFSGHRQYHCMHSIVIMTNERRFAYISAGYPGHCNDAQCFRMMPSIGPNNDLQFPADAYLFGDNGYACEYPVVSPYRRDQINGAPTPQERDNMLQINQTIRSHRIYIEHLIGYLKHYRCMAMLNRHPRWEMACLTELCVGLADRRLQLFDNV